MQSNSPSSDQNRALAELRTVLSESKMFVKAHAAEFLIWTGYPEPALEEFLKEEELYSAEPKYRIVIWRVLAQAESDPVRKQVWVDKISAAYNDLQGPDRTHATETLAKLKQPVSRLFPEVTAATLNSEDKNLATYALWASSFGSEVTVNQNREKFLNMVLTDQDLITRKISAFVLRQMGGLDPAQWNRLADTALATGPEEEIYVTLLATAMVSARESSDLFKIKEIDAKLTEGVADYSQSQLNELALALAEKGERHHLNILRNILENKYGGEAFDPSSEGAADLRASAAYAILKIHRRIKE